MTDPLDLPICTTCGTQYAIRSPTCKICDDPRQYIPASGQTWTTLTTLQSTTPKYTNTFTPTPSHPRLITIRTTPKLAIGQRAFLCLSPRGNILWDCLTYIDEDTISQINALGGLAAIVISHPHYFASNLVWAEAFGCPVYISGEDGEWVMRGGERQVLWEGGQLCFKELLGGDERKGEEGEGKGDEEDIVVIKTGGHFPGSSVLWWKSLKVLLVADTIFVVPSGIYHVDRVPGTTSFSFMWSYPNLIPLPPDEVHKIWKAISHTEFEDTFGAFEGAETFGNSRQRVLESAKIIVKAMGYTDHAIHAEECS